MKRVIGAAAVLALCAGLEPIASFAQQSTASHKTVSASSTGQSSHKVAPADEYFGPLKMSFLGIRNEIHDLTLRYDAEPDKRDGFFGMAVQTETSLKDWERKYPNDSAIPRQVYFLRFLYDKFDRYEAQLKRDATDQWLLTRYGNTWYAKDMRKRIAAATPRPLASDAPNAAGAAAAAPAATTGTTPLLGTGSATAPVNPATPAPK